MKHKLFAATLLALAVFVGYLAHAGFPTIVPLVAPTPQSAHARLAECAPSVAVAERNTDVPAVGHSLRAESVGLGGGWLLDPRPMMGTGDR